MELSEAIQFISPAIDSKIGTWADIGAGTGIFTEAIFEILKSGKVIAVDKNPHSLYSIVNNNPDVMFEIVEGDFHQPLHLPPLDGILMANALHYAKDHLPVLQNVTSCLVPGGTFVLIEYNTEIPNKPWVPNPLPFHLFEKLCESAGLQPPVIINTRKSIYQDGDLYVCRTIKHS